MAAVDYFPYSGDGGSTAPHRPSLDNLGGASKEDDQAYPPDPTTMPTADEHNVFAQLLAYAGKMIPVCKVSVTITAGTPAITYFLAIDPNLTDTDITVTDLAAGSTRLSWVADTFPTRNLNPDGLTLNEDAGCDEAWVVPITNGIEVYTEAAGTPTDCNFTVSIYG